MKAMVFAAGIGSRLKELTQTTPKCLMQAGGKTLLEHVLLKLKHAGVTELVINTHHLASQVATYLEQHDNFGLTIHISYEQRLLDTGGGLRNVQNVFNNQDAFIVHNADVYCTSDIEALVREHRAHSAVATLGVVKRNTTRGLFFDSSMRLVGWTGEPVEPKTRASLFDFSGISICSSELFSYMGSNDTFSIIEPFLRAARASHRVFGSPIEPQEWIDIGTPETLSALQERLRD